MKFFRKLAALFHRHPKPVAAPVAAPVAVAQVVAAAVAPK